MQNESNLSWVKNISIAYGKIEWRLHLFEWRQRSDLNIEDFTCLMFEAKNRNNTDINKPWKTAIHI